MFRPARRTASLAAATLLAGSLAVVSQAGAASAATTMQLAGDVLPSLSTYQNLGASDPGKQINVDVTIARPNPAGEQAAYTALYTPSSSTYHDFLTPAQFDAKFGVSSATASAVRSFVTARGLSVVDAPASNDLLVLSGTVAQVQQTFGVTIRNYRSAGTTFYANTAGPRVPSGLSIDGVIGLNSKLGSHLYHDGPDSPVPSSATHGVTPAQSMCTAGTCIGLTTPQDLWSIYEQPGGATADPNGNKTVDFGQGQSMAVFGEGMTDPVITNLRTFERVHNLPRVPISVIHTDGTKADYSDDSGEVEWDLDTQSSTGMSPDVTSEKLYFGHDLSDASVLGAFGAWAEDKNGPLQANASYGECEENPAGDALGSTAAAFSAGQMYTLSSEAILQKANFEGRTLFSSAGDTGSSCPVVPAATLNGLTNSVVPIVNYPASSPHAVDVGGTVLYGTDSTSPTRALEYSWTYTGGGTSFLFAKPNFQNGIVDIAGVCDYSPGGGTANVGKPCRGAPDVAAQSGDVASNGYGIVAEGETDYPGGGTSLASPLWMGMWTRIQATAPKRSDGRMGLGNADETLYKQFKNPLYTARDFFDIGGVPVSTGNGVSPPAGNGSYVSTPGWDYTSGMGTPRVANLAMDISGTTSPTNPVLPTQPPPTSTTRPTSCTPLFTDPMGDDAYAAGSNTGGNPQLDILSGNLSLPAGGAVLRATIAVKNFSTASAQAAPGVPSGAANEYYLLWTYNSTTYFANAEVDTTTGMVKYSDGVLSGSQYNTANTDTGSYTTGPNGGVEIDVPLANVGSPAVGNVLTAPGAQTEVLVGSSVTGGSLQSADSGGPQYDYTVGDHCP